MHRPKTAHATLFAVALCAALAGAGCSMGVGPLIPAPNERPRVTLTAAPVNEADTSFYAYELHWSGFDPDGRVDHYEYAVDPKGGVVPETTWIRTTRNQETIHFHASQPDSFGGPHATDPHTFVIKAMDNSNQWSPVVSRAFFAYTIAPTVQMTSPVYPNPAPSSFVIYTGPAVRISWEGRDEDAVLHRGPVLYKYKLLSSADADWASIDPFSDPNGARRRFAATNFAGWDSTESDTPFVELKGLEVGRHYLFLVVAIDEAGAYTADWAVGPNLLPFVVAPPAQVAPRIALECPFANYMWPAGGADPTDEREWLKFDVPSSVTFTLHWFAVPSGNYRMAGYRWRLDGDLDGPGWTEWSLQATQATLGPAEPGTQHFLYIQAKDDHGAVSTAVVYFSCIRTPFDHDLLVVDDTRLEPDQLFANGTRRNYTATWPAAAELDTFLYAVGGTPWRGTPSGRGGTTPPGLFSGYSFDTLGTRNGFEIASAGVPLSLLGRYRHVVWLTDRASALSTNSPINLLTPMSTLRWMNTPGRPSSLAAYSASGGRLWYAGGAVGYASNIEYNSTGIYANDNIYGFGNVVFSSLANELAPGRLLWDDAHWRSEVVASQIVTEVRKSSRAVGGWTHPGPAYTGAVSAPDYSLLPPLLRRRTLALGDTLPPTRATSQGNLYWTTGAFAVEYLAQPNAIVEDADPDPLANQTISVLDTLYELNGGPVVTNITGYRPAAMTYYHGFERSPNVFTGFPIWEWTRADCAGLVDFVLHDIWGLQKTGTTPAKRAAIAKRSGPAPVLRR